MKKRCFGFVAVCLLSTSLFADGGVSGMVVSQEANELMDALNSSRSAQVSKRVEGDSANAMKFVTLKSSSGELVISCRRWQSNGKTTNVSAVCEVLLPVLQIQPMHVN